MSDQDLLVALTLAAMAGGSPHPVLHALQVMTQN
jgi:hypothetical protein